jgi:hypothetical protein
MLSYPRSATRQANSCCSAEPSPDASGAQATLDPYERRITDLSPCRKAEAASQGQHAPVLRQGHAAQERHALFIRLCDEPAQQGRAEAPALPVVRNDDGEIPSARIFGIDGASPDAHHPLSVPLGSQRDEGELARRIDVGPVLELGGRRMAAGQQAKIASARRQALHESSLELEVFPSDRPNADP